MGAGELLPPKRWTMSKVELPVASLDSVVCMRQFNLRASVERSAIQLPGHWHACTNLLFFRFLTTSNV